MSDELNLVIRRRREISDEIVRLEERVRLLKAELPDLAIAEKVLARLSGASGGNLSPVDEPTAAQPASGKPEGTPTVPEMIHAVFADAEDIGMAGLEPKTVAQEIARRWWPGVKSDEVSPIMWRMWKRKELSKDGALYMRPKRVEVAGDKSVGDAPATSNQQPGAQGREAGPGGGT